MCFCITGKMLIFKSRTKISSKVTEQAIHACRLYNSHKDNHQTLLNHAFDLTCRVCTNPKASKSQSSPMVQWSIIIYNNSSNVIEQVIYA